MQKGLKGRSHWLFLTLFVQGVAIVLFSQMTWFPLALLFSVFFGVFVHMATGATYSVVPFINKKALGSVAGIVGAGGNVGGFLAGFLFKGSLTWPTAFLILGLLVIGCSFLAFLVRFTKGDELEACLEMETRDIEIFPTRKPQFEQVSVSS